MKKYIGSVSDFGGGIVRMLNNQNALIPHFKGGANCAKEDLVFVSYEETKVNKDFLAMNGIRFLTDEEVAHFFRGENMKGEKLKKPEAPKISEEEKAEMKRVI
nr:MAG TPA: hypothetical protein [Caudoviricetes sp.]